MAAEANKKLGEQRSQEHADGPDLAAYVHLGGGAMSGAVLAMRHEAATGRRLADKVVGLLTAEEVKEREAAAKKAEEAAAAGSDKNKGVYLF